MAKVNPFHTSTPEKPYGQRDVHHDNSSCEDGKRILPANRVNGTGGRPKCDVCKTL